MIFNGVTEYLKRWCRSHARANRRSSSGKAFFFEEMAYKLMSLVDREADSFGAYLELVRELVPVHRSWCLRPERGRDVQQMVEASEAEFLDFLEGVTAQDTAEPEQYYRVILGKEKERLEYEILEKWDYSTNYWYPLSGDFDENKLFIHMDWFEPYLDQLCQLVGLPGTRLYEYGESFYGDSHCAEVEDIFGYGGHEAAYLPKDLSWLIYFSHESTVTFAGAIMPMVRELLAPVREHWNRWE